MSNTCTILSCDCLLLISGKRLTLCCAINKRVCGRGFLPMSSGLGTLLLTSVFTYLLCFLYRHPLLHGHDQSSNSDNQTEVTPKKPHIKKPLNAFMLFMKEMRAKVAAECTLKESAAINQILGRRVSYQLSSYCLSGSVVIIERTVHLSRENHRKRGNT